MEVGANLLSAGGTIAMALFELEYWALVTRPVMLAFFIVFGSLASMSLDTRAS